MDSAAGTWSGFHRLGRWERLQRLRQAAALSDEQFAALTNLSALPHDLSSDLVENSVGSFPVPLGVAVNFVVDGQPTIVPMAVEESSVIAAASHGAKLAGLGGGFRTKVADPVTIGQVELRGTTPARVRAALARNRKAWTAAVHEGMARMVERGGGVRGYEVRAAGPGRTVLHVLVDTRDAMGANVANGACETLGPLVAEATGARLGLRILSNLADHRLATARATIPFSVLPRPAAQAIVAANRFALEDPYRAATHNKGILNGVDPVLVATGNDWRAVEAGAHAYAARSGRYKALTTYRVGAKGLEAKLEMPLSLGTVGGVTRLHPTARACLRLLGDPDARRLSAVAVAVGLAQNLAALKALAGEGIQEGHMRLHAANRRLARRQT